MPPIPIPLEALVIESDPLASELLQRGLEDCGFRCVCAQDWEHLPREWQARAPHLLVAPLSADGRGSGQTIRRMRALERGKRTLVLATHPRTFRPDRQALEAAQVDDLLAYPIEPDDLEIRLHIARTRVLERLSTDGSVAAQAGVQQAMARSDEATVIATLDEDGRAFRIASANTAFERLTGYSAAAVVGRTHRVLVESRDSESLLQCLRESALQSRPATIRVGGLRQDGRAFPVEWSITPLPGEETARAVLCILRPIGTGPDLAQQVRAAEEKFRNIVDVSIQGVLVHQDWRLRFINRTLAELLGYPDADSVLALGRLEALIPPDQQQRLKDYNEARKRGHAPEHYALEMLRRDGSRIALQGFVRQISWEGEPAVMASYVDVSGERKAQAELQASRALMNAVFDAIPHNVYVKDRDGKYLAVNKTFSETWQLTADQVPGTRYSDLVNVPAAEGQVIESTDQEVLAGKRIDMIVSRTIPGLGLRRFRSIKVPLTDRQGDVAGLVGIAEDVTDKFRAEQELSANRALLQAVFDTIPHSVFVKDRSGKFIAINATMAKVWQRTPQGAAGREFLGTDVPAERAMIQDTDRQVLETGELLDHVVTRTMLDGSTRHARVIKHPLRDELGVVTGLVGMAEDVTERFRRETELRESRALFQTTFDAIASAVYVKDRDGRYLLVNRALSTWWGLAPEAFVGQRFAPNPKRSQEEIDGILDSDREVLASGRTVDRVFKLTLPMGERSMRIVKTPLRNSAGEVVGLVGIDEDITDQLAARDALQRSQTLLRTVFDAIPHHVFVKNAQEQYVTVNRAFLNAWGGNEPDYVGKTAVQAANTPPEEMDRVRSSDQALLATGIAIDEEITRTTPMGIQHHRVIKAPVHGSDGRVVGLVGIAEDISERKRAEEALRLSEERFRRLIEDSPYGILIHRNRAPLYVNTAFARMFGYASREEVLALDSIDYWVANDELRRVRSYAAARLQHESGPPDTYEFRGKRKDGTLLWVQNSVRAVEWEGQLALQANMLDVTERRQAEAALDANQRLLRTLFDTLPQSIHVKDLEGRYQVVNNALARAHGVSADDLVGKSISDIPLRTPGQIAEIMEADRRAVEERRQVEIAEFLVTRPDSTTAWERVIKSPLLDETGNVVGVVGIAEDITARKRAEDELRNSQRLLQTVFDTLPQSLSLKDIEGRYLLVNKAFQERNAVSRGQIRHQSPSAIPGIASQNLERIREAERQVIATGTVVVTPEMHFVHENRIDTWVRIIKAPVHDDGGRVTGIVSIAEDLTSRVVAEDRLRENERLLQTVINALPQSIHVKDLTGTYRLVNRALMEQNNLSAPQVLDHTFDEVAGGSTALVERIREADREVLATGKLVEIAELHLHPPGRPRYWVRIMKTPLRNEHGHVVGIVTIADDITARKEAEAQRLELERQVLHAQKLESLGVLAGGIAHDFNNLLTGILGNVELAMMDTSPTHPAAPTLQQVKQASLRAAALTQQMLAYSGRGRLQIRAVELSTLVEEMAQLLRVSISKKIAMHFELDRELPSVEGDAAQLQQIVMNLITNASEAIGDANGVIRLSTGRMLADRAYLAEAYLSEQLPEGEYVYMEVTDTGAGMSPEVLARIFDPFFTTKFTGRGLGLAAVLGIVRSHHGTIHIRSAPGQGSTFRVLFPAFAGDTEPVAEAQAPAATPWRGQGTALVIDDEDMVRSVLERQLKALGFSVWTASGGQEGVARFTENPDAVSIVLLDMTMPGQGGAETLRALREIRPGVRVIVCSGFSEQDAAEQFKAAPPDGFLQKPTQREELSRTLQQVLG